MSLLLIQGTVLEGTDNYNVAAVAVRRAGNDAPVLLTTSDITGNIALSVYLPSSSTAVYSTTFAKTLVQDAAPYAVIHTAVVDSLWEDMDTVGHNFAHKIREADLTAGLLVGARRYTFVYAIPTVKDGTVKVVFEWTPAALH